jgi:Domain of unknown function (DUF6531)
VTAGRSPMVWARSYSSARIATSPLGRGWISILDMRIEAPSNGDLIRVVQENGSVSRFWMGSIGLRPEHLRTLEDDSWLPRSARAAVRRTSRSRSG